MVKCPKFGCSWDGEPKDFIAHLDMCPTNIEDFSSKDPEETGDKFALWLLNEARIAINNAQGNIKAGAFAAANANIKRAIDKLEKASKELVLVTRRYL